MKIISFGVNNFRGIGGGIDNNTVEFNKSNTIFLLGQNNAGKSSFLKAYEFFYKNSAPTVEDIYRMNSEHVIEFELVVQLDDYDFQKDSIANKREGLRKWLNPENMLKIKRSLKPKAGAKITFEKAENFTWDYQDNGWVAKNYGGIGLDTVFQAALPTPIFIKAMPTEAEAEAIINEILKQKATAHLEDKERQELKEAQAKIQELQNKLYNPVSIQSYKDEVNKYFQSLFPNTKIELTEKDKSKWTENSIGKSFSIHFEHNNMGERDVNIPTNHDRIGHGAVRSAIFSLLLLKDVAEEFERLENRKDYIVLFEEPELFLHPKLMKQLRSLIYKVSESDTPYQVLCASHSPQMIDITKEKSSLVRMIKTSEGTRLFQINDEFLKESKDIRTKDELKQEMNEVLRFNPFICESFYADEVILIEGPTEEIILRGYLNEVQTSKDIFVVNCGTVNNIPFFQKIFSRFNIKYHVICDSDAAEIMARDIYGFIPFETGIQKSIYQQFKLDQEKESYSCGLFQVNIPTFEPAHQCGDISQNLRYPQDYLVNDGKPYNANLYWKNVLHPNLEKEDVNNVPIIKFLKNIVAHN
ncbi:ATP-dependent nuclease [Sphingobacterium bambusae]|uniref:ATP-dependent endonuclease n=1 Tax=Sphingobacterium bambusae TaxID=662858 RepID=A0ABW6BKG1_9SPHI|nr:AAA family ATPase [Sphingobacterium bambusae]WPL51018.1 AAA family ATPase [Sphingobacterium bambusae]